MLITVSTESIVQVLSQLLLLVLSIVSGLNLEYNCVSKAPAYDTQKSKCEWMMVNTAASMRVLNVLRHWITKHPFVRHSLLT